MKTWAHSFSKRLLPKPTTSLVTVRPPQPFLAQNIVNEGLKNVAAGANPMQLKRGIEAATEALS